MSDEEKSLDSLVASPGKTLDKATGIVSALDTWMDACEACESWASRRIRLRIDDETSCSSDCIDPT
jgi:hypothetical protein